jgi:hypothetical protein
VNWEKGPPCGLFFRWRHNMFRVKCRLHMPSAAVVVLGLLALGGCVTSPAPASKEMAPAPAKEIGPPAAGAPAHTKPRPLIESEKRLSGCGQEGSCDRLHFMTGLSALQSNPDTAAAHFRDVIRAAPKSSAANLSRAWLKALEASTGLEDKQVVMDTTEWLLLELLNRDKQVEELSKQLNALKLVDLEMKERTSRMKPRIPLPKPESGQ